MQSNVTIKIFDASGRKITVLVNEEKPAGIYEINRNVANFPSGVYFYRLQAGDFFKQRRCFW